MGNRVTYEDLADLAPKGGSSVTYDDLKDLDPDLKKGGSPISVAPSSSSLLQRLADSKYVSDINTVGGKLAHGVMQGVNNLTANMLPGINIRAPEAPFVDQNSRAGAVASQIGQYIPATIVSTAAVPLEGAGLLNSIGGNALRGMISGGGGANPGNKISAALQGGLLGGGLASLPPIGSSIKNSLGAVREIFNPTLERLPANLPKSPNNLISPLKNLDFTAPGTIATPDELATTGNKLASNLYNQLSGGKDTNDLKNINIGNIIANGKSKMTQGSQLFKDFLSNAEKSGYNPNFVPDYTKTTPSEGYLGIGGRSPNAEVIKGTGGLGIKISPSLSDSLNNIYNAKGSAIYPGISSNLKSAIYNFRGSPSLANAHTLQSALGSEASDIYSNLSSSVLDKANAKIFSNVKNNVLDTIGENLSKNGHLDLLDQFRNARNYWKGNVVPYQNIPSIASAMKGGSQPNPLTLLPKNDTSGNIDIIKSHLSEDPSQTNALAAQYLSKNVTNSPDNEKILTLSGLNKGFSAIPDNIRNLIDPNIANQVNKINALHDFNMSTLDTIKNMNQSKQSGLSDAIENINQGIRTSNESKINALKQNNSDILAQIKSSNATKLKQRDNALRALKLAGLLGVGYGTDKLIRNVL